MDKQGLSEVSGIFRFIKPTIAHQRMKPVDPSGKERNRPPWTGRHSTVAPAKRLDRRSREWHAPSSSTKHAPCRDPPPTWDRADHLSATSLPREPRLVGSRQLRTRLQRADRFRADIRARRPGPQILIPDRENRYLPRSRSRSE